MSTQFTDDFNRADGAFGANYTDLGAAFSIVSNQGAPAAGASSTYVNAVTPGAAVWARLTNVTRGANPNYTGILVRLNAGSFNGYYLSWDSTGAYPARIDAGTPTFLGGSIAAPTDGQDVYIEIRGSTIRYFYGALSAGNLIASRTDATYSAAGRTGLIGQGTGIRFDNLSTGTLPTLSSPTPSGTLGTSTTATVGATTDEAAGTLYVVVDTASLTGITEAQILTGQNASSVAADASGNAVVSTTTPSVDVTGLAPSTAYNYAVLQTSGGYSNIVTGTFTTGASASPPSITDEPDSIQRIVGDTATFTIVASGATSYQWQENDGGGWVNVSTGAGATTQSYTTAALVIGDTGMQYRCVATNTNGSTNSAAATLTVVSKTRPAADVTTTGWQASSGSNLSALLDETSADDGDYVRSPDTTGTPGPLVLDLIDELPAGTYRIRVRADVVNASVGVFRVLLINDAGATQGSGTWQEIDTTFTTYEQNIVTTGRATRIRIEVNDEEPTAPTLPSWVPTAGEVATLTNTNGKLTNHFRDIVHPHFNPFYSKKIVTDYGGSVKNPHWGTYGCQIFHGGGHSATNDNMVAIAEYGENDITFKRVCDPTQWTGGIQDIGDVDSQSNATYAEATADGRPLAPHPYGVGVVLGPTEGGSTHGSYVTMSRAACNHPGLISALAAHKLNFANTTDGPDVRTWARMVNATGSWGTWTAPTFDCLVADQNRIYFLSNGATAVRWFDLSNNTWNTGSGTGFDYDESDGFDSGAFFYVPSRDLLICMYRLSGNLKLQWMDVSASQPTLGGTATLSSSLAVPLEWNAACWCPDNNRIIVGGISGDTTGAYEIEIPATLTNSWTVTRRAFGASQSLTLNGLRTYKKWSYDEKVKSIVIFDAPTDSGDDTIYVYRPFGT